MPQFNQASDFRVLSRIFLYSTNKSKGLNKGEKKREAILDGVMIAPRLSHLQLIIHDKCHIMNHLCTAVSRHRYFQKEPQCILPRFKKRG